MDTKGGKWQEGGGGVMNWEIGIDMYTLMGIKWMTNKNLLYTKINKIKLQKKTTKKNTGCWVPTLEFTIMWVWRGAQEFAL